MGSEAAVLAAPGVGLSAAARAERAVTGAAIRIRVVAADAISLVAEGIGRSAGIAMGLIVNFLYEAACSALVVPLHPRFVP